MKMKYVDIAVTILFVIALLIIYIFWGCNLDLYVTILAGLVIVVSVVTTHLQNKKIKKLSGQGKNIE